MGYKSPCFRSPLFVFLLPSCSVGAHLRGLVVAGLGNLISDQLFKRVIGTVRPYVQCLDRARVNLVFSSSTPVSFFSLHIAFQKIMSC